MHKIAVMGSRDSIYGFASVGIDIYPVDSSAGGALLRSLAENDYGIIYITEDLYERLEKEIKVYESMRLPAIIPIPGALGNSGMGMQRIKKLVEKAVGSDIIFD